MAVPPDAPQGLLAFDTSTEQLAVALACGPAGARRHLVRHSSGGAAASAALLPAVHGLLAEAGLALADLSAIAFGRGPGAFTGLRTSCAVAQGLAFGLGRPALPVDSLLIVAEQARRARGAGPAFEVGVVMDARMGEIYAGRYRWQDGAWQVLQAPGLCTPAGLAADWDPAPPAHSAGTALPLHAPLLHRACAPEGRVTLGDDRATALLALAASAWSRGEAVDAADALPVYVRDKVALTTAERAAARAAAARP